MARAAQKWILYVLLTVSVPFAFAPNLSAKTLAVGILAHRGDDQARQKWHPTFEFLSGQLNGHRLTIVPLTLQGMSTALETGDLEFVFTNPGNFHELANTFKLEPLVSLRTERAGEPRTGNRFGAVIFVRADNNTVGGLADLRNKRLGAVAPGAFGGFRIAADTLLRNGINPWRDLAGIEYYGFPQDKIVTAVLSGEVEAGTVRTGVIESLASQGKLSISDIRIMNPVRVPGFELALSTQLFPEWVLGAAPAVPETLKRKIAISLLGLKHEHPAVRQGNYAGWTTITNNANIAALIKNTEPATAGATSSRSTTWLVAIALAMTALLLITFLARLHRKQLLVSELASAPIALSSNVQNPDVSLTPREEDILSLVRQGMTSKQIARKLKISHKTVEFHRSHLLRKFNAQNMTQVVGKVQRRRQRTT